MMGCGGRLGLEALRANLDDLRAAAAEFPVKRGRAQTPPWCHDRKPPCLCATVTQESSP